ncbi:unnamed protein product [Parnassius mnemosyne]|uniref:Reverse transcriptase domain-containing protein n=1 Tax=Parnassius mnemosyne TaxID=213953 RepID=A0AAV1LMK9_9NEOP
MLSNRKAKIELFQTSIESATTRGCAQGGVLSPLLWNLAVDQLLYKMADIRIDTLGYADDLVIVVRGFCQSILSSIIQRVLNTINNRCRDNSLSGNADTTVIMPFTNKRRLDKLVQKLMVKKYHSPLKLSTWA